jgi:hypothetical protein
MRRISNVPKPKQSKKGEDKEENKDRWTPTKLCGLSKWKVILPPIGRWASVVIVTAYDREGFRIRATMGERVDKIGHGVVFMASFPTGSAELINPSIEHTKKFFLAAGFPEDVLDYSEGEIFNGGD